MYKNTRCIPNEQSITTNNFFQWTGNKKLNTKIKSKLANKRTNNNVAKTVKNNIARCIRTVVKIWGSVEPLDFDDIVRAHAISLACNAHSHRALTHLHCALRYYSIPIYDHQYKC